MRENVFAPSVPENPVKLRSPMPPLKVIVSVPADTLILMLFASVPPVAAVGSVTARVPVEPEYVRLTVLDPVMVKLVDVLVAHTLALFPVTVIAPVPKASVRALLLVEIKDPQVNVLLLSVSAPVVSVTAPVMLGEPDRLRLRSALLIVQDEAVAVAAIVTVAVVPLFASNVAVSAVVGADANGAPPEVADQLVTETLSHVPDPPTQKRAAIT